MKKIKGIFKYSWILTLIGLLWSCTSELDYSPQFPQRELGPMPLMADVTITSADVATRINKKADDGWSNYSWQTGDIIGFFSVYGNNKAPEDAELGQRGGPFINTPMIYRQVTYVDQADGLTKTRYTFVNDDVEVNPVQMTYNSVYVYFPYDEAMGSTYKNAEEPGNYDYKNQSLSPLPDGIWLRKYDEKDGITKCVDELAVTSINSTQLNNGVISTTVYHNFSELIIMRGEGFDNPPTQLENGDDPYKIIVKTDKAYSNVRTTLGSTKISWSTSIFYDKAQAEAHGMTEEECKEWRAWEGKEYLTIEDDPESGKRAWYVIVPTVGSSTSRSSISSIQLYNNDGILQNVTSFNLNIVDGVGDKRPSYRTRYPIEIRMTELGPTVYPYKIESWDEGSDITDERTVGIWSVDDFEKWRIEYAQYTTNPTSYMNTCTPGTGLYNYGDLYDDVWHFYVNSDIVFNSISQPSQIDKLTDILEGTNRIENFTISGLKLTRPLIKEISGKGGIVNLDFAGINVNANNPSGVGALAEKILSDPATNETPGVVFNNCNIIQGTVINNSGPVGILAGYMSYGTLNSCKFSGLIMGSGTANGGYYKLLATDPMGDVVGKAADYPLVVYTGQREIGISSVDDFMDWIDEYSIYRKNPSAYDVENPAGLSLYGAHEDGQWTFLITRDLNFSGKKPQIASLTDIIKGINGATITGLDLNSYFIEEIKDGGGLMDLIFRDTKLQNWPLISKINDGGMSGGILSNLEFQGLTFKTNSKTGMGALAVSATNAMISNITVTNANVENTGGAIGIFAGTMNNGTISGSSFAGEVKGYGTAMGEYSKLLANTPTGNLSLSSVNCDNLNFTNLAGISSLNDFNSWLAEYNQYVSSPTSYQEEKQGGLRMYGSKGEDGIWHFPIKSDINFAGVNVRQIVKLTDIIDGGNKTLRGLNLNSPFIGTMENRSELNNLNFEDITVSKNTISPLGALVENITAGSLIADCEILNGRVTNEEGPVGILASRMEGGSVTRCSFSGIIKGLGTSETHPKIIASDSTAGSIDEVDVDQVEFEDLTPEPEPPSGGDEGEEVEENTGGDSGDENNQGQTGNGGDSENQVNP